MNEISDFEGVVLACFAILGMFVVQTWWEVGIIRKAILARRDNDAD